MDFSNKKVLVYGMGISGKGLARLLHKASVEMVLCDDNEKLDKKALLDELGFDSDIEVLTGGFTEKDLEKTDILAISPGISVNAPCVRMARDKGIPVLGELEIAYELSRGRLFAITGTNGKTTTTALTGEIMKAYFNDVFVVGNIGISYASVALDTTPDSVTVAEVSSFQLETIKDFHPEISAVLNITPDHLDRHGTFENYAKCKMDIAANQTADEKCVINYDDEYLRKLSSGITPEPFYFSRLEKLDKGIFLDGETIVYCSGETTMPVINVNDMNLLGNHNIENVMAAAAVSISAGVPIDVIRRVIKEFKAVEHRIEFVREVNGVSYYNDSKGTNTDAASKAVDAMKRPIVLIAGGYDKGADFTDWIKGFGTKVRAMVLIGKTAGKIASTAKECGFAPVYIEGTLEPAVKKAASLAENGDCVLLSPACASWDQFSSYEQRGKIFKEIVNGL